MRQLFTAAFFFLVFPAFAQRIERISGEYTYEEKIGLHSDGVPTTLGDNYYLPREPYADTTVLHKLCLNSTHGAFLERDTSFRALYVRLGSYQWIGNWELNGDSLVVAFNNLVAFYPFSLQGTSSMVVEKLPAPLIQVYLINETTGSIHLAGRKEYEFWDFEKKE